MRRFSVSLILLVASVSAISVSRGSDVAASLGVGTLGFGVQVTGRLTDKIHLRGAFNTFSISRDATGEEVDYSGTFKLQSEGVYVDWHPMAGGFRVCAGLMANQNKVTLKATPTTDQEIGGNPYTPAQIGTLSGKVSFSSTAPYLGIGAGNPFREHRVHFLFDAGVMFSGSPKSSLSSSTNLIAAEDLRAEEAKLDDDLNAIKYWPVLTFGVSYRF